MTMDTTREHSGAALVIRLAEDRDAPALHRIYSDPQVAPQMGFDPCSASAFQPIFAALQAGDALHVCEANGQVVGAYRLERCTHRLSHVAKLGSVAVDSQHMGNGLAQAMIAHAIEHAANADVTRIELTVAADNLRAIAFWRKLGFEVEGRFRNYFSRSGMPGLFDELAMALHLPRRNDTDERGLISKSTAPHYAWGNGCDGWRLADGNGLSVIEERMPPGTREVRHIHAAAQQVFYVLEGTLSFQLGDDTIHAVSGQAVRIPPGTPHHVWATADGPGATFLVISQPTTRGDRHPTP